MVQGAVVVAIAPCWPCVQPPRLPDRRCFRGLFAGYVPLGSRDLPVEGARLDRCAWLVWLVSSELARLESVHLALGAVHSGGVLHGGFDGRHLRTDCWTRITRRQSVLRR